MSVQYFLSHEIRSDKSMVTNPASVGWYSKIVDGRIVHIIAGKDVVPAHVTEDMIRECLRKLDAAYGRHTIPE